MHYYWGSQIGWLHMIGMGLFWALVIGVIVYLIKSLSNNDSYRNDNIKQDRVEDAIEIAKKRYAKGEITKDEYKKIVRDLKED